MTGPLYEDLAATLRSDIALGRFGPRGELPSEAALGRAHGLSRITVRHALDMLREEGLVVARKGAGWFVTDRANRQPLGTFQAGADSLRAAGRTVTTRLVTFELTEAPAIVATALELAPGSTVLHTERVDEADDVPFDLVTTHVAPPFATQLTRDVIEQVATWEALRRLGHDVLHVQQALTATVARRRDARLLRVATGTPLLLVERVAHTAAGRAAISEHRYPGGRVALDVEYHGQSAYSSERGGVRLSLAT